MDKIEDLNLEEQKGLKRLLDFNPAVLTLTQKLHLKARRSYLSNEQKFKYCGVLYFSRPALRQELKGILKFLSKFTREIIVGTIVGMVVFWLIKFFEW